MKAWMFALLAGRRPQLVTQTFTANGVLVVPASVNAVDMTGFGARGQNAYEEEGYREDKYFNIRYRDGTIGQDTATDSEYGIGPPPAPYCGPWVNTPSDPNIEQLQTCYAYYPSNYDVSATRGASATGIGKTFPGSLGNVAQTPTVFTNVAVTPGASYNIVVPTGGSVTISYYV